MPILLPFCGLCSGITMGGLALAAGWSWLTCLGLAVLAGNLGVTITVVYALLRCRAEQAAHQAARPAIRLLAATPETAANR